MKSEPKTGRAQVRREEILRAAGEYLVESGMDRFTLDAVALRAGVSKGGLIHHFPSKDELLRAMVEGLMTAWNLEVEAELERAGEAVGTPGRYLRAYVRACLVQNEPTQSEAQMLAISTVLLGANTKQPGLLQIIRGFDAVWQARIEADGVDPMRAVVLRAAADGFWMSGLLGFESGFETPAQRAAVRATMLQMIDEAARDATR